MKKIFTLMVLAAFMVTGTVAMAQEKTAKEIVKERRITAKLSKKELNEKATKDARKEAKRLAKEGWMVNPGALPLEKMLDRSFAMQYEYAENGAPLYLMGFGQSIGGNLDAAKMQATEMARLDVAGQIEVYVTELIESTVANEQMSQEQATSITRTVAASKSLISQRIGRLTPVVECYRTLSNKNKEVMIRVAYNTKACMEAAKQVIKEELEKKGEQLHDQLDKMWEVK